MRFIILLTLSLVTVSTVAQSNSRVQLQTGLRAAYFAQPGVSMAARYTTKAWHTKNNSALTRAIIVTPKLTYYALPGLHNSLLLNVAGGYRQLLSKHTRYIAFNANIGYLWQNHIVGKTVNLGTADGERITEIRHAFLPSISFEYGRMGKKRIGWFMEYQLGHKIAQTPGLFVAVEFGLNINLRAGNKNDTNTQN